MQLTSTTEKGRSGSLTRKKKKKNTSLPHQILKNLRTRNNFVFLCGLTQIIHPVET